MRWPASFFEESILTPCFLDAVVGNGRGQVHAADGPFTTRESLPLVTQIADALSAIHGASIIHRDLKPGNVMLVPVPHQRFPRAVLIDFG
jgi:serine/threonine protein kinase